jgi:hypothetical protein
LVKSPKKNKKAQPLNAVALDTTLCEKKTKDKDQFDKELVKI